MIEHYREVDLELEELDAPRLRWVMLDCGGPDCKGHRTGLLGQDVCGVERWVTLVEHAQPSGIEEKWESTVVELARDEDREIALGWQLSAAAYGLAWAAITLDQVVRQSSMIEGLPRLASQEMWEQGPEALMGMRRLVGTDIGAMPVLLNQLGVYRNNVGGRRAREDWQW